jgi:hypothetical protein
MYQEQKNQTGTTNNNMLKSSLFGIQRYILPLSQIYPQGFFLKAHGSLDLRGNFSEKEVH